MAASSLETFLQKVQRIWEPGRQHTVDSCRTSLAELTATDTSEPWLAQLLSQKPATRELLRDRTHGFMLLAHTENEGLYRPPHDHGRAWVVYAVHSGELEVGTYAKVRGRDGATRLTGRESTVLRPGEARAYLIGEVHDTRCLSETALLFRFTERDLRHEDQVEGKVTRFVMQDDEWTAPHP